MAESSPTLGRVDSPRSDRVRFFALLIGASALPFALLPLAVHVFPQQGDVQRLQELVIFLGSGGHVAASFFFYGDGRMRAFMLGEHRGRYVLAPIALIVLTSLLWAVAGPTAYAILVYWIWQTHHYTRQNHGILSFASQAEGRRVHFAERTAITLTGVAGVIAMSTFVTPYQDTVLAAYGWQIHATALGVFACAWAFYLYALLAGGVGSPLRAAILAVLMLFYLPLFVFDDPTSAVMTYAIAHGLQYLVFMGFVAAVPTERRLARGAALVAFVGLGGLFLFFMQQENPWGPFRMAVFGAYLGLVMWHFVLDAGAWRLSESFQRSYMAERFTFLAPRRS